MVNSSKNCRRSYFILYHFQKYLSIPEIPEISKIPGSRHFSRLCLLKADFSGRPSPAGYILKLSLKIRQHHNLCAVLPYVLFRQDRSPERQREDFSFLYYTLFFFTFLCVIFQGINIVFPGKTLIIPEKLFWAHF